MSAESVFQVACLAVVLRSWLGVPGLQDGHAALVLAAHEVRLQVNRTGGRHVADGAVVLRTLGGTPAPLVTKPGLQATLHSMLERLLGRHATICGAAAAADTACLV